MDNLIAELEAATEGSRELDAKISAFIQGRIFKKWLGYYYEVEGGVGGYGGSTQDMPSYTTSLDAAVTLMPEGCVIELCQSCPVRADDTWWDAYVFKRPRRHDSEPIGQTDQGLASPALALCCALFRARQAMEQAT